jgi:hypothetical protein
MAALLPFVIAIVVTVLLLWWLNGQSLEGNGVVNALDNVTKPPPKPAAAASGGVATGATAASAKPAVPVATFPTAPATTAPARPVAAATTVTTTTTAPRAVSPLPEVDPDEDKPQTLRKRAATRKRW